MGKSVYILNIDQNLTTQLQGIQGTPAYQDTVVEICYSADNNSKHSGCPKDYSKTLHVFVIFITVL